jgi:hypothetical protein
MPWNYLYVEQRRDYVNATALSSVVRVQLHPTMPSASHMSGVVHMDECDRRQQTTPRQWCGTSIVLVANGVAVRIHHTRYWRYTGGTWMHNAMKPTPGKRCPSTIDYQWRQSSCIRSVSTLRQRSRSSVGFVTIHNCVPSA